MSRRYLEEERHLKMFLFVEASPMVMHSRIFLVQQMIWIDDAFVYLLQNLSLSSWQAFCNDETSASTLEVQTIKIAGMQEANFASRIRSPPGALRCGEEWNISGTHTRIQDVCG